MATVTIHHPDGTTLYRQTAEGTKLSDVIGLTNLDTPCGGKGRCGKCRVLAKGKLSPVSQQEETLLGETALKQNLRLSCLAQVMGDCEITLRKAQVVTAIQSEGIMRPFQLHPLFQRHGVAIDIGTTTLAGRLYSSDGILLAQATAANPQREFGSDVITRIEKSLAGQGETLKACILAGLNQLIAQLKEQSNLPEGEVDTVVLTGNTTMLYLLTGRNVDCLSHAPFEAEELFGRWAEKEEVNLTSAPKARIYLPRCISAFVGADITSALLASGIYNEEKSALLADIGTNGELALWHNGELHCCSTAAGPVFEGAAISQGMQAGPGAIDQVTWSEGKMRCHVLGESEAVGICGSGLIDALAVMVEQEIVDEGGAFVEEEDRYALTETVWLTQKDIRQLQLAKAALCGGMLTLLEVAKAPAEELNCLAIAGGFGSFLNLRSGAVMGLFPALLEPKAKVLGNAALAGASMILLRQEFLAESQAIATQAKTIDLSSNPIFTEHYMNTMAFE